MSDYSAANKQEHLATCCGSIVNLFERDISPNIARYILGSTNAKKYARKVPSYVVYINNILSLSFVFAYGCLKCDINNYPSISERATSQSSLRIINSLTKAYSQYPVTHELVQFVLTDIQFEMDQNEDSELYDIFKRLSTFGSRKFSLIKYFKLIAEWRAAPVRFNMDSCELADLFYSMLQNMEFLKTYDLVQDDEGCFSFVAKDPMCDEDYRVIPVNYLLYYNEQKYLDMFSLFSMEKNTTDGISRLNLRYICEKNSQTVCRTVCESQLDEEPDMVINRDPEEVYAEICAQVYSTDEETGAKKNPDLITQVHTINYKYIKNLALAISDAIDVNTGSKNALYESFSHHLSDDIFGGVDRSTDIETQKIDWDSIVVMLLIEYSPTSVLETLFMAFEKNFVDITRNLCKRIDNVDMPLYGLNKRELMQAVDTIIKEKLIFGESSGFGKIPNLNNKRLKARAQALLITSSLSAIHEEENVEKSICAGNIYDNLSLLEKMKSNMTPEQRCKYVCIILSETFRHILCFYRGLLTYGELKADFDMRSSLSCLSETTIAKDQKMLHESFMSAAKAEANRLKQYNAASYEDMQALLQRFMELCEACGSSGKSSEPARRALYCATGKYELLNVVEFKRYVQDSTAGLTGINEANVNEWITIALHILEYLRNGTFELSSDNPSCAIYPYTATYNHGNENYDGYKTVTFTLDYDNDGDARSDKKEIKVLSEFTYNTGNVFYCLPNILRTSNTWWIDPVMIDFKAFNEIFLDD